MSSHSKRVRAWAVASGSYSDYRVHAFFEKKAEAQAHVDKMNVADRGAGYEVEEFPYFPAGVEPGIVTIWTAYATGPDFEVATHGWASADYEGEAAALPKRPKVSRSKRYLDGRVEVPSFSARALDRAAAVKAVSDAVAAYKAQEEGL
jgi:hypothetical protein